ncbi:MAG TPA: 4Fe-4S dicluster domain-containing protein, partial [Solirubrobacteraceae bacterium]|nr:4Fe-4S dicluster domain-containing protein [Solirubrobacteraceae bacterium]
SMEVDPEFIGPAALAKAYRFVGDPRDDQHYERLKDLAEDPHGIYDCTHCFMCIDACPKGVAPMDQIMRLRRRAGNDWNIEDRNNGERHESAFVTLVKRYGLLNEAELLPRSYGGDTPLAKFKPAAAGELASQLPAIARALLRRKVTPAGIVRPHRLARQDRSAVRRIYKTVDERDERLEFNVYISGRDEDS